MWSCLAGSGNAPAIGAACRNWGTPGHSRGPSEEPFSSAKTPGKGFRLAVSHYSTQALEKGNTLENDEREMRVTAVEN